MSDVPPDSGNPYQSPSEAAAVATPPSATNLRLLKLLRDFRSQIVAIGAFWIIIGGLTLGLGIALAGGVLEVDELGLVGILIAAMGLVWVALGVLVCFKQMWALYAALVLSYLSAVGNLINLNLCALTLLVVVIVQAHRVLGFAKQLNQAGIPLTTKPKDLEIKIQLPT